jgi:hypothetical protein
MHALLAAVMLLAPPSVPVELGRVAWSRDLDAALAASASSGKPVFLLFQEIPGCQGCRDFGSGAMSHPLLVEAIETAFIPVAVNNRGGTPADDALLVRYEEPKLNYPVARLLDAEGRDLVPRRDQVFRTEALAVRMVAALEAAERDVPAYLRFVADAHAPRTANVVVAMHCYWEGEAKLGAIPGVLATRSGWMNDLEVVEMTYDPAVVPLPTLLTHARRNRCTDRVFYGNDAEREIAVTVVGADHVAPRSTWRDAEPPDQKYHLRRSPLRHVPMPELQAVRVNAALAAGEDPRPLLSPGQRRLIGRLASLDDVQLQLLDRLLADVDRGDLVAWLDRLEELLAHAGV